MNLRTELHIEKAPFSLMHSDGVLCIGSCFAEHIGQRLGQHKFEVLTNPYGTLFNPISIAKAIDASLDGKHPDAAGYVQQDGLYLHHEFHSDLRAGSQSEVQELIIKQQTLTADKLKSAKLLVITCGTSYVHLCEGNVVANCHRQPSQNFTKHLLTIEEMYVAMHQVIARLRKLNPQLRFLFTVSPVRHTREGLPENMLSKSQLRVLCHQLVSEIGEEAYYFPSYELMMDDLRDYRFYGEDLIHPNQQAVNYIWEGFQTALFSEETRTLVTKWEGLRRSLAHRPYNPGSMAHQQFLKSLLAEVKGFADYFSVKEELQAIENQLV